MLAFLRRAFPLVHVRYFRACPALEGAIAAKFITGHGIVKCCEMTTIYESQ